MISVEKEPKLCDCHSNSKSSCQFKFWQFFVKVKFKYMNQNQIVKTKDFSGERSLMPQINLITFSLACAHCTVRDMMKGWK